MACTDGRCVDGLIPHDDCNGFGWLTMGGRKYRKRTGAANLAASTTKQGCEGCGGTKAAGGAPATPGGGLVACGCIDIGLVPGTLTPRPGAVVDLEALTAGVDPGPQWAAEGAA